MVALTGLKELIKLKEILTLQQLDNYLAIKTSKASDDLQKGLFTSKLTMKVADEQPVYI
jgi:hypothetical protein